jgi:hypothetical protein
MPMREGKASGFWTFQRAKPSGMTEGAYCSGLSTVPVARRARKAQGCLGLGFLPEALKHSPRCRLLMSGGRPLTRRPGTTSEIPVPLSISNPSRRVFFPRAQRE